MTENTEVVFISSPFAPIVVPSIGLGLLKAGLDRLNVRSKVLYFNLSFAALIGEEAYQRICDETNTTALAGEWIFSESLFGPQSAADVEKYIDGVLRHKDLDPNREDALVHPVAESLISEIVRARSLVASFVADCVCKVLAYKPRIVGFTSVFQQHVAALSLAKRIKALQPETHIVFGGGNCEGVMGRELLRQFPFVDVVVSGEGDAVFPAITTSLLNGKPVSCSDVVFARSEPDTNASGGMDVVSHLLENLDSLPIPDYDDYFEQLEFLFEDGEIEPRILIETSRGCWWGAKHHCTFCGLNGTSMAFRSKTANRAFAELLSLADKYPGRPIHAVDNILDMKYFRDFLPLVIERQTSLNLAYEVKSNLTKHQLSLLKQAGIDKIQPGIESFSDTVLKIMRKGVTGLQNIQLLKWCAELGVAPAWNLIWGFPGEPAEDYREMEALVPLLTHLHPPYATARLRIDRFSPNYDRATEMGFTNLAPYPAYSWVYPLPSEGLNNLAYFFTYEYASPRNVASYTAPLAERVLEWIECHETSRLFYYPKGNRLFVWDSRPIAKQPLIILEGLTRLCYEACDEVTSVSQLYRNLDLHTRERTDVQEIEEILATFCESGLAVTQGGRYLALAVRTSLPSLARAPIAAPVEYSPIGGLDAGRTKDEA